MSDGRKDPLHREVLDAVVGYLHHLANGEFPDKITEADIPEDLIPLVRTAALLGFQLEAREARRDQAMRGARREAKRLGRDVAALKADLARRPELFELTLAKSVRDRVFAFARAGVDMMLAGGDAVERAAVARTIHRESRRVRADLVSFSAATLDEVDVDRALFGAERRRGQPRHDGAFRRADGGTLFVDDVASLNSNSQARLVRFLKNREILPVGAARPVRVNVRLVLGLSEALTAAVQAARVRVDLARCLGDRVVGIGLADGEVDASDVAVCTTGSLAEARVAAEVVAIRGALRQCDGNRAAAARLLGLSREGFRQKVKRYDIVI